MRRFQIRYDQLQIQPLTLWHDHWLLLTSGDFASGHYNCMTVGWGSLGTMWRKPFAQVVVRPTRYTYEFMNRYPSFTLCAFPNEYNKQLAYLGSVSGRDNDKIQQSGLTPIVAQKVAAPAFAEADLILECRKTYWQDFDNRKFLEPDIEKLYSGNDYHRVYFGEIVNILAAQTYRKSDIA